jgi:hypothetical protein
MHQIRFVPNKDPTLSQCHNISCFCVICIDKIPNGRCDNELHVPTWTLKKFKPTNSMEVREMMLNPTEEIENVINGK